MVIHCVKYQNNVTKLGISVTNSYDLANLVKKAREKKGLTANQLADLIKIKGHAYRRYERGEVPFRAEMFIEIAQQLSMSVDELAGLAKPKKSDEKIIYQKIPSTKGTKIIFEVE